MDRANEACDGERVSVNGRTAKDSYDVKVGDIIEKPWSASAALEVLTVAGGSGKGGAGGHVPGDLVLCLSLNLYIHPPEAVVYKDIQPIK